MLLDKVISDMDNLITNFSRILQQDEFLGKSVVYFTADIPVEIVTAAGLIPIRIPSDISSREKNGSVNLIIDSIIQPFVCAKSRHMMEFIINNSESFSAGIFSENHCDSLQNIFDLLQLNKSLPDAFASFRFLLPVKRGGKGEANYYYKEIKRLVTWLQDWTGKKITYLQLKEAINLHNKKRTLLLNLADLIHDKIQEGFLTSDLFKIMLTVDILPIQRGIEILEDTFNLLDKNPKESNSKQNTSRILISGSMFDNYRLFEEITQLNNSVVANDLTFGSRSNSFQIDINSPDAEENDTDFLIEKIANSYIIDRVPDSVHHFPEKRKEYLIEQINKYNISGVIFIYYSFCDPDAFESRNLSHYLENTMEMPCLTLVTDPQLTNIGQLTTRVEAFIERIGD